jgi:ABC-type amino acid transport substrate-binding protein
MKKILIILIVLFVAVGLMPAQDSKVATNPSLQVGVTPIFPPMIYKENGKIVGVEADFANALGKALNRRVVFVEFEWQDQIPLLKDKWTDIIMSDMSITPSRQLHVAFSKPYLNVGQIALVRREDAPRYAKEFPLPPPGTVGVVKATTGDFMVQQEFPRTKCKRYSSSQDGAKALIKKRIDLFISDAPTIYWLAGLHESDGLVAVPVLLTHEQLAWAMRPSDTNFVNSVNAALAQLQASGRADEILKHWIPQIDKLSAADSH